jgi:membrane protease YdiL (CAAX protease family)
MKLQVINDPDQPNWRCDGPRFAFVAWIIATIAVIAISVGAAIVVSLFATVRAALAGDQSGERLGEIAKEAIGSSSLAWTLLIASQVVLLACAWLACRVLRKPARARLGLVATYLEPMQRMALLVATVVPFGLGLVAAWLLSRVIGSSSVDATGLQRMWHEGSRVESVVWILLIGLLPGFVEEVFYRGLLLRGFLLGWGPGASILVSSMLFAVVHGDPVSAAAIFPLGLWLGWVAWRTDSILMTFAMHASVNGLWTAGMMYFHRDPASELMLTWIAIAMLAVGLVAFPWAIAFLQRRPVVELDATELRPMRVASRVAVSAVATGAVLFLLIPPGATPLVPGTATTRSAPKLADVEAGATANATCTTIGEAGACEFFLMPGIGTRIALPRNHAGIDQLIVLLDDASKTVWLAYAGELSGKGNGRRPLGIVEQLTSGEPTVVCMTLTTGPPPVKVRLTLDDDQAVKTAHFERAAVEDGWAIRGRK